jgi:hypothetical protein
VVSAAGAGVGRGTFAHWVLAGLQPTVTGLVDDERPAAAVEGRNHFGEEGYSGPRPPVGDDPHRYVFWVFRRLGAAGVGGRGVRRRPASGLGGQGAGQRTLVGMYHR